MARLLNIKSSRLNAPQTAPLLIPIKLMNGDNARPGIRGKEMAINLVVDVASKTGISQLQTKKYSLLCR